MQTIWLPLTASCFAILILPGYATQGAGPLPEFTFRGVALHPKDLVYQDHTAWGGGNIKYVEVDSELNPVGPKGERFVLLDPSPDPPLEDRYRGGEFYLEGETLFLYSSASSNPRIIVYANASTVAPMASRREPLKAAIERDRSHPIH